MTDLVRTIREKLANISEWPWKAYYRVSPRGARKQWHIGNKDGLCQITIGSKKEDYLLMAYAPELLSQAADEIERLQDHLHTNHDIAVVSFSRAGVRHDKESCATCKVLGVIQKEAP